MSTRAQNLTLRSALSVTRGTAAMGQMLRAWRHRRATRRALARLDAHMLRDIGLSSHSAADEIAKPFWRD